MRNCSPISAIALALAGTAPLPALAESLYAAPCSTDGEGVSRFPVHPQNGTLNGKTWGSRLTNPAELTPDARGKTRYAASGSGVAAACAGGPAPLNQASSQEKGPVYLSLMPAGHAVLLKTIRQQARPLSEC